MKTMYSPAEQKLEFLVGSWISSDRTYPGATGPGGTSAGKASYAWGVGGRWLLYEFQTDLPGLGPYLVQGGVAYDEQTEKYKAYSVNNLGNLLLYEGIWESDTALVFTLIFPERQDDTRVSYHRLPDGTVRMTSERPSQSGDREMYFETLLQQS
jgi:hypothetical protein